ncbi:hypothetical protein DES52_10878 [Deinococcus yavapaiensis KR-236]|uniref:MFS transporter n=1 Tax=Deinococcus yavapaiensis KR-236 TaxID=694435 RepID=A0A318SB90_9DEIO|nr:hypothetical protein DES52_10878 [Deinococcus yavapaiensis KR-236]
MKGIVTTAPAQPQGGGRKILLDLVFTLLIPIAILSPNLLGSGFSFSESVFGGGVTGNVRSYVLAALVPVAYVLVDLLLNKRVSPIAIFAGTSALVGGALAFWFVDGWQYALKDSARSILVGVAAVLSVFVGYPLFRIFVDVTSLGAKPDEQRALTTVFSNGVVKRALGLGTFIFAAVELVSAAVNFFVNLRIVTSKFGTNAFNAEVASANAVMRVPALALSLIGFGIAYWLIQQAVTAQYGKGANIFEPAQLAEKLRETPPA